jgi:transcriptional regulator with XRE-family HTH domain
MRQDLGKTDPVQLGELMRRRQVELDLTWQAIADRAGLSRTTLNDIRNGKIENTQPRTIRAVERALQWTSGSIDSILAGGDPTPLDVDTIANGQNIGANASAYIDDHSPSRATLAEIIITLTRAAQRDGELGRGGQLFWATWDVVAEVNHPRQETPTAVARGDRSA